MPLHTLDRRRVIGLLAAGGALIASPAAAVPATPIAADLGAQLDAHLRGYADPELFTGAALIVRGEETLLRAGYGIANRITDELNAPETAYQIASLTKAFTALAIVQLGEEGTLSLDDPVTDYLPEVVYGARDGVAVTIRHLLSHTAGIPEFLDYYDVGNPFSYPRTREQLVADIIDHELEFTPGTDYRYSNSGYIYAGLIIERRSGMSYEAFLRERIWQPAGMTSTFLFEPPDPAPPIAKGYGRSNGQIVAFSDFGRVDLAWAAGGITSTVDDMLRWHRALLTDRLAPQAAIDAMYVPVLPPFSYGLGWEQDEHAGRPAIEHSGQTIGYVSTFVRFLDDDVVVILLSNEQDAHVIPIANELAELVFGG